MANVFELDEVDDWPAAVHKFAARHRHRDPDEFTHQHESELHDALGQLRVRFFHCTRLTPHEQSDVLETGLHQTTRQTAAARIEALHETQLTSTERTELLLKSETSNKPRPLFFFAPKDLLGDSGTLNLLCHWGGEALYGECIALRPKLQRIGDPAFVLVDLDLRDPAVNTYFGMARAVVARSKGTTGNGLASITVSVNRDLRPDEISAVHCAGSVFFSAHAHPEVLATSAQGNVS